MNGRFQVILKLGVTTSVSPVFSNIIKKDSTQISDVNLNVGYYAFIFFHHQPTVERISLIISNVSTFVS